MNNLLLTGYLGVSVIRNLIVNVTHHDVKMPNVKTGVENVICQMRTPQPVIYLSFSAMRIYNANVLATVSTF